MEPLSGVPRIAASASAVVAAFTTVVYVLVIVREGDNSSWAVFPWIVIMAVGTFSATASAWAPTPRAGHFCAIAATVILGVLGLVAIFSIGIGFIMAAVLAGVAAFSYSLPARTS